MSDGQQKSGNAWEAEERYVVNQEPSLEESVDADIMRRLERMHSFECPCGKSVTEHQGWLYYVAGWVRRGREILDAR